MLDRDFLAHYPAITAPGWGRAAGGAFRAMERLSGTHVRLEGLERLPKRPALLATNSSQKYDFMPIRSALDALGVPAVTVTKAKNYHQPVMRFLLQRLGVIPLASKGYLIALDFQAVHGRRPSEEEYRALRDHLDLGAPLPASPALEALQGRARALLGHPLELPRESYREALRRVYRAVMAETVRLCRQAMEAGYHVQIYPEGTVSSRLAEGRPGSVQFARALDAFVVPIGMSGCREAFRGQGLSLRGGDIALRVGEPFRLDTPELPPDFRPFDPEDEQRLGPVLRARTEELVTRIDALLDPAYRRVAGAAGDGTQGVRRFL